MSEKWKHISQHELPLGYEVSSEGNLRIDYGDRKEPIEKKLLNTGYLVAYVRSQILQVHRVVAETFIPNEHNYRYVIHLDGNKQNNSVENLRWAPFRGNATTIASSLRMGKPVRCKTTGDIYNTLISAQAHTGIPIPAIEEACKSGDECFGLQFEYLEGAMNVRWSADDCVYIPTSLLVKCSKTMKSFKEFQEKYPRGIKNIEELYKA